MNIEIKVNTNKLIPFFVLTFIVETIGVYFTQNLTGIQRIFTILAFTFVTMIALALSYVMIRVIKNMVEDRMIANEIKKYMSDYEKTGNLDKLFQNFKKIKNKPKTDYAKSLYYFNLAIAYAEDKQFSKAREVLKKSTLQKYNTAFNQIFTTLLKDIEEHEKHFMENSKSDIEKENSEEK